MILIPTEKYVGIISKRITKKFALKFDLACETKCNILSANIAIIILYWIPGKSF